MSIIDTADPENMKMGVAVQDLAEDFPLYFGGEMTEFWEPGVLVGLSFPFLARYVSFLRPRSVFLRPRTCTTSHDKSRMI